MFDRRLAVTVVSVLAVTAGAVVAALWPQQHPAQPIQELVSDVAIQPEQSEESPPGQEYLYLIREHNGRIAVFGRDSDIPELVLDKLVKHLPEYDRIQMQEGIPIQTEQELAARIEDFTS